MKTRLPLSKRQKIKRIFGWTLLAAFAVYLTAVIVFNAVDFRILSGFREKAEYFEHEFRDNTDYAEYYYQKEDDERFVNSRYYSPVDDAGKQVLTEYLDDYMGWLAHRENYAEWFSFRRDLIDENDYFCLHDKSSTVEKDCYTIYFYDVSAHTLYYFHQNS